MANRREGRPAVTSIFNGRPKSMVPNFCSSRTKSFLSSWSARPPFQILISFATLETLQNVLTTLIWDVTWGLWITGLKDGSLTLWAWVYPTLAAMSVNIRGFRILYFCEMFKHSPPATRKKNRALHSVGFAVVLRLSNDPCIYNVCVDIY